MKFYKDDLIYALLCTLLIQANITAQSIIWSDTSDIKSKVLYTKSYEKDNLDIRIFRSINNSRNKLKDNIFDVVDRSVIFTTILTPLSQFAVSNAEGNVYDENSAIILVASEIINFGLVYSTKTLVRRNRPYQSLNNVYTRKAFGDDKYSFPSGHSSFTFTMATSYLLRYPQYPLVYMPVFAYALLTSYGRPYFGMHYPSDILAGALYGISSAIIAYSVRKPLIEFKSRFTGNNTEDETSVRSLNSLYFCTSFALSAIINTFILKNNETVKLNTSPEAYGIRFMTGIRF